MTSKFEETFPKWISARRYKLPLVTVLTEKHGTRIKVHQTYDELVDYCYEVFKERFNDGWYNAPYIEEIPSVEEYFLKQYKFPLYVAQSVIDSATDDNAYYGIVKDIKTAIQNSKRAIAEIKESIRHHEYAKQLLDGSVDKVYAVQFLHHRDGGQYEGFQLSSYNNELVM